MRILSFGAGRPLSRLGEVAGLKLSYDDSAVCHWLSGTLPRPPVRSLVCEALAWRLHRPITLADAGLGPAVLPFDPAGHSSRTDIVRRLVDLGSDMDPTWWAPLGPQPNTVIAPELWSAP